MRGPLCCVGVFAGAVDVVFDLEAVVLWVTRFGAIFVAVVDMPDPVPLSGMTRVNPKCERASHVRGRFDPPTGAGGADGTAVATTAAAPLLRTMSAPLIAAVAVVGARATALLRPRV